MTIKISVITATKNNINTIESCLKSISIQTFKNIQLIWIDGGSTDGTKEYLEAKLKDYSEVIFISELDYGVYDALNKGLLNSTGDIIGFLHADDVYAHEYVLKDIAVEFLNSEVDVVYGDLMYVAGENINLPLRIWKTGEFSTKKLNRGWMPPHPTLYIRRRIIEKVGLFNTHYKISSDYDHVVRIFRNKYIKFKYIPDIFIKMRVGGISNRSLKNIIIKTREDFEIIRKNRVGSILTVFLKNITKIKQFYIN